MKHGQWMLNQDDGEHWRACEYFDTKEEAIEYGVSLLKKYNSLDDDGKSNMDLSDGINICPDDYENIYIFYVGQIEAIGFPDVVDNLLETISETVYNEVGEYSDGYMDDVTTEHKKELADLIHGWAERNGYLPDCYIMGATEEVNLNSFKKESKHEN